MSTAPSRDLAQENEPNGGPSSEYARLRELLVGPERLAWKHSSAGSTTASCAPKT